MADSKIFGGEKAPAGKEFRDSGSLGRGLKDLRKDVNVAFLTQEDHIENFGLMTFAEDEHITLNATTLFSDLVVFSGGTGKELKMNLTAAQVLAAINAKFAEYGSGRTAVQGDTIKLRVINHSTKTLAVTKTEADVTIVTTGTGADILADTSADVYISISAVLPAPAVNIFVAL